MVSAIHQSVTGPGGHPPAVEARGGRSGAAAGCGRGFDAIGGLDHFDRELRRVRRHNKIAKSLHRFFKDGVPNMLVGCGRDG